MHTFNNHAQQNVKAEEETMFYLLADSFCLSLSPAKMFQVMQAHHIIVVYDAITKKGERQNDK